MYQKHVSVSLVGCPLRVLVDDSNSGMSLLLEYLGSHNVSSVGTHILALGDPTKF